ncbi:LysR family transcriptional regulator [Flexibacterium corallicola]|uniref:LysR family transcriptional regulator n=1 Tax=Flexibacterium corallicola TaxID=3037259 RepID=UPI00286EF9AA|nr:LysR family transcriptional regulator [Pseudovibrio sp. M1P-2-3]
MTHEQLVVLKAIVTQGTFRAAAEHLNKSQSALSHMLKKLEDEVGVELLSRAEYRPKLTPEGEVFYRNATRVLFSMQELKNVANCLSAKQEAEVVVAVDGIYPLSPLLGLVSEMAKSYPATHIRLTRESMGGVIERLYREEADIIITTIHGVAADMIEALPHASTTMIPVAHRDFEPAKTSYLKSTSEMQNYTQIIVADSSQGDSKQTRGLLPGGLKWTVSDFPTKKEILLKGMGWGGMPDHYVQDELEQGELVALNVEGYPDVHVPLFQMRKRGSSVGIVAQAIWEKLLQIEGYN